MKDPHISTWEGMHIGMCRGQDGEGQGQAHNCSSRQTRLSLQPQQRPYWWRGRGTAPTTQPSSESKGQQQHPPPPQELGVLPSCSSTRTTRETSSSSRDKSPGSRPEHSSASGHREPGSSSEGSGTSSPQPATSPTTTRVVVPRDPGDLDTVVTSTILVAQARNPKPTAKPPHRTQEVQVAQVRENTNWPIAPSAGKQKKELSLSTC